VITEDPGSSDRNTDRACESKFGGFKYECRRTDNIAHGNAAAVALTKHGGLLRKHGDRFLAKRPKRKPDDEDDSPRKGDRRNRARSGHLAELGVAKASVMRVARKARRREREYARADRAKAADVKLQRRQAEIDAALARMVKAYAKSIGSFEVAPLSDVAELDAALARDSTKTAKLRTLRGQIDLVCAGYGLAKRPVLSSDVNAAIGKAGSDANLAYLRRTLVELWSKTAGQARPTAPAVPEIFCRAITIMGEATSERDVVRAEVALSEVELKERADALRAAKPARVPRARASLPAIDGSLVGCRIKVVWQNTYGTGRKAQVRIEECPGVVAQVADGETELNGKKLGPGWVYVKYDEGEEDDLCWKQLQPHMHRSAEPGGWWLPAEGEDCGLEHDFELESNSSDDEDSENRTSDSERSTSDEDSAMSQ
jgi:hypothetical protein